MKVSDLILGPIIAALAVIILVASSMQPKPVFGGAYGGGFFPTILGAVLLLCGLALTYTGWRKRASVPLLAMGNWVESPRHVANTIAVLGTLLFYILTSGFLGFIISAGLACFALLWQFTRRPVSSLVIALVTVIVAKWLFQDMLLVPLPWGFLEPFAGVLSWRF